MRLPLAVAWLLIAGPALAQSLQSVGPAPDAPLGRGPTFDCTKARSPAELVICEYPRLAALDREIAVAYGSAARRSSPERAARLRDDQREWLRERDRMVGGKGGSEEAFAEDLADVLRRRIRFLEAW
jgi:uncharacterized protein